jgi:membrane protein DedA with SNARE-associated domain
MDSIIQFIQENRSAWTLVIVCAAAALEYMVPPLPADSVLLAASLLIVARAWSFVTVLSVAVAGGFLGSCLHYALGRALSVEGGGIRGERFVEKLIGKGSMERFFDAFRRRGAWVILFNRMLPGVRGATFIAAGAARLPPVQTLLLGLVSNIGWTAAILTFGTTVGGSWEKIQETFTVYSRGIALVVLALLGAYFLVRAVLRRRGV